MFIVKFAVKCFESYEYNEGVKYYFYLLYKKGRGSM